MEDALKRAAGLKVSSGVSASVDEEDRVLAPFVSPWHGSETQPDRPASARPRLTEKPVTDIAPPAPLRAAPPERTSTPSLRLESLLGMGWPQPFSADVAGKLVTMRGVDRVAVQQYRRLAATVHHAASERGIKSVLIASPGASEGKTLSAVNLALTSSELDQRVLLIDANLQQPRLHRVFQVSAGSGLAGCLQADGPVRLPVVEITARLALLPAGLPAIEAAALGSDRMRRVLMEAAQRFDLVLIDSAAGSGPRDSALPATFVDSVIVVVDAQRTSRQIANQLVDAIGRDRVMGVLFNRARPDTVAPNAK